MRCQTPGCTGEHETQTISHQVVYRETMILLQDVPAEVCPECGEALLAHETIFHLGNLLGRRARSPKASLAYKL